MGVSVISTVTHDAKGNLLETPLENVPNRIGIDNDKLTNKDKLDKTLEKYKGIQKDDG